MAGGRTDRTKPWPEEVEYYGLRIFELQRELLPITKVMLRQGIENRHYNLIELLFSSVEEKTEEINEMCLSALTHNQHQGRGRPEKWVIVIREIRLYSETILECLEEIRKKQQQHRWQNVRTCLLIILDRCKKIKEQLIRVPINRNDIPIPFREVIAELDDE